MYENVLLTSGNGNSRRPNIVKKYRCSINMSKTLKRDNKIHTDFTGTMHYIGKK